MSWFDLWPSPSSESESISPPTAYIDSSESGRPISDPERSSNNVELLRLDDCSLRSGDVLKSASGSSFFLRLAIRSLIILSDTLPPSANFLALLKEAATACFCGCPAATISEIFLLIVCLDLPGCKGISLDPLSQLLLERSQTGTHDAVQYERLY